jgi:hypothetical protein
VSTSEGDEEKKYAMFTREMGNYATLGPEVASRTFISVSRTCGSIFEHTDPSNLDPNIHN